jgi:hypothetical protein
MKGIKIAVTVLMSLTLIFFIQTGFAQINKKDSVPQTQQPVQEEAKQLITIIRDCYVPYIDTEKLYAVVTTSFVSTKEEVDETGKPRGIGREKSTASEQKQTVQQTYEYTISPDVEVREQSAKGLQFNIETVAGIGYITKADIFVMKNKVIKIIILDIQQ